MPLGNAPRSIAVGGPRHEAQVVARGASMGGDAAVAFAGAARRVRV
ncbi:hypothetical protein HDA32_005877 [Spinactinospora alkalitolerans]|uniref:Uncharacterized protein n=1 Tax=Spinactinospora alkalitolerans TaxID=687207 RepID=A0A852U570_9ACTN|nr:hypothetical protein [Spinactinospora alkalitolerans]